MKRTTSRYVPLPKVGTKDFPADLTGKREFRLTSARKGCHDTEVFKVQPVQQFVSAFMSPVSPYKSILLFHGTGVGKTCAAIQAAEMQHGSARRTLVIVPSSIQGGFESNVYNASRVKPDSPVRDASRHQCTGSRYYSADLEGLSAKRIKFVQRAKARRRYEFMGHDKFANMVDSLENRARRDFGGVGEETVATEFRSAIVSYFDNRLIVVDEVHELRSYAGEKPSYTRLKQILQTCKNCKLIMMTATPMYNRSVEIVDLANLMLVNDRKSELSHADVFDSHDAMTPSGEILLKAALHGRVSVMTYEDPEAFPATLYPSDIGVEGFPWKPPALTRSGTEIPVDTRISETGEYELFCSMLSSEQLKSYSVAKQNAVGMQLENVCYDGASPESNEEAFYKAFKRVPGGKRMLKYAGATRYLHPDNIDKYAPKIGSATRLIQNCEGLSFQYSNFRASGVFPVAIALEEMGFLPYTGNAILHDAPGSPNNAPRYIMITKDDEASDSLSTAEKVEIANDPRSGVRVVLGTETAAQGLDFKRIREVHVLEPWWNMSRIRQVIGRGVRRCSHVTLPAEKRNTTVFLHCTTREKGQRETLDQRIYREALNKNNSIREVEALISDVAVDCGLYETRSDAVLPPQVSGQRTRVVARKARATERRTCDIKWSAAKDMKDDSTVHPIVYKNMVDLLAFEIRDVLEYKIATTFGDLLEKTSSDEMVLSIALTSLMNPMMSWKWLGDKRMVQRGPLYVLVPKHMVKRSFTISEARLGFMFTDSPKQMVSSI